MARVTSLLRSVHEEIAPSSDYGELCTEALKALQELCTSALEAPEFRVAPFDWSPDVRLEVFGSAVQGTALRSSDLDVRMTFEQFTVHEAARQSRYLKGVADLVASHSKFDVVRMVDEARLPVLRLRFVGRLEVDLTMGCELEGGAELDVVVRDLLATAVDDGALRFVLFVKAFAKAHNLIDAYKGYLNSLSWVFLAIVFLQLEGALPSYRALKREGVLGIKALWPARVTASSMLRFFALVERCGSGPHYISFFSGNCGFRRRKGTHPLVVESPCGERDGGNIANCLKGRQWNETVAVCEGARAAITSALSDNDECDLLLQKLFETATPPTPCPGMPVEDFEAAPGKRRRVEGTQQMSQ